MGGIYEEPGIVLALPVPGIAPLTNKTRTTNVIIIVIHIK
jgi:hypothetical protein